VNRDGERGDEVPRQVDGLYRVLVAGGSQPEGYLLNQEASWPGTLQHLLQSSTHLGGLRARNVHVGNIARSGAGSEALDLILERVLPRYPRLQMIIILVGASDVLRWLELGAPPAPPPPVQTPDVFRCHPEMTFGWTPKQLAVVELFLRTRQRWLRPTSAHDHACKWIGKARAMRSRAKEIRTVLPDPAPMLAHFDEYLRKALQKARAHADRVLLVRQPWFHKRCTQEEAALMWHGAVGRAWRQEVTTFYSHEVLSDLMTLLDARAACVAQELGIEQLDLMPILTPGLTNYYDFFHATPKGARTIARAVASAVLRQSLSASVDRLGFDFAREGPDAADAVGTTNSSGLRRRVS
jgi:lysophospholipase L1-like esterase